MFGRWKVIGPAEDYIRPDGYHEPQWLCEYSCENHTIKSIRQCSLKCGQSKSCGCLSRESASTRFKKYNESELHKEHNTIRRQVNIERWKDETNRKQYCK